MAYSPRNTNSQATMANSAPIVIASDQSIIPVLASGLSAVGVAPALNPISVSGVDAGGLKRHLRTGAGGVLLVDASATTQPVSGTVSVSGSVTTTGSVTVSGLSAVGAAPGLPPVAISGVDGSGNKQHIKVSAAGVVAVDGSAVTQPISGSVTVSGSVTATGPLTDTQLRATALPISGSVTATGPLTDTQLRASSVPVTAQLTPGLTVLTAQATSVTGVLNYDLLTATVSGWYDASAYIGRFVSFDIIAGASVAGGAIAFEQTGNTTLDASGKSWNLQDSSTITQSMGASQTPAASTTYQRHGVISQPFIRFRLTTALTAGTLQVAINFAHVPLSQLVQTVAQATGSAFNAQITGSATHSAAASGNPVRVAAKAKTTSDITLVDNDASDLVCDTNGSLLVKQFAASSLDWYYVAAASGIVNTTTAVTIKTAAGASLRNYITGIQIGCDTLGAATEFVIRDGAAGPVLWRIKLQTTAMNTTNYVLQTPIKGTANTLLEIVTLTASVTGGVYFNAQGYIAA